jgi:signal transduction histidine kinase
LAPNLSSVTLDYLKVLKMRPTEKPHIFGDQLFRKLRNRILVAATVVMISLLILTILFAAMYRANILDSIGRALTTQSQLLSSNAHEGLNLADYVAKQARAEWQVTGRLRPHSAQVEGIPNFQGAIIQIAVIDASGYLSASSLNSTASKLYLGDRAHFIAVKDALKDEIHISKPVIGRVSGKETVQFVRPIFSMAQEFIGVVVVSLDTEIFLVSEIKSLENSGTFVTFIGDDNIKRFGLKSDTVPSSPLNTSVMPPAGVFSDKFGMLVPDDYFSRIIPIPGFPLKMIVSKSREEVMVRLRGIYLSAGIVCVAIVLLAFLFTGSILRLIRSKRNLLLRLEASNLKANSANEMKSKFVSGISHELRTPLNGILGFSELAKLSETVEESRRYSEVIFESAQRLHQLVNMLLDLAKIEAGQMQLTATVVKTTDFFESIMGLNRDAAEKKDLVLSLSIQPSTPSTLSVDRIKLMQVISNLVGNSVKFTESGVIFLGVEKSENSWIIKVIDTGIGMTQEKTRLAFERFGSMQLYDSVVVPNQGAGLGLALCKDLLDLMEGTIDIQSEPNSGTTVTVTFKESND